VTDLRRHVPRVALEWDDQAPGKQWQSVDASLVFADISGFTALTERLARRGRIGAEELIETLNRVFGGMLGMAALRGGELLKFGGDALLFTFRGEDHVVRACAAAVDMRIALREAAKIPTSVGRLKLSMSVGIHSGPVDFFLVGAPTRELLILGPAATATAEAEHAAVAGEILVTADTARRLPAAATLARDDDLHLLRWRRAPEPGDPPAPMPSVPEERLRTLFPNALGDYLAERVPDPEHKVATIGFARFSGTDALLTGPGHDAVADALHRTISVFEEALIGEGVTLLATDLDSDGGKLFMGSGVPYSSEDDEGRMLRAMRDVLDAGTPLPLQIGVNRGHVFAAEVGALERAAYSAMGDTTNTAARIMAKAPHGVLFAHPTVLEQSRTLFSTEPAGPFAMKGKTVPVPVFDVGEELGTREAAARTELPLIGREEELATLRAALERALGGEGGTVTVSAATGLGKSRLITEAMRGLDATVSVVRAEPYGMTSPYRMLRDPVRLALGVERGEPEAMTAQALAGFARRMPDLLPMAPLLEDVVNVPIPPTPEASAIEPRFRPARVADMVVRLVESAVRGPFVLLVEEAHWSDAASITVLERVVAAAAGRPWAVVVARRTEGEGFAPEGGTHVTLEPLPARGRRHRRSCRRQPAVRRGAHPRLPRGGLARCDAGEPARRPRRAGRRARPLRAARAALRVGPRPQLPERGPQRDTARRRPGHRRGDGLQALGVPRAGRPGAAAVPHRDDPGRGVRGPGLPPAHQAARGRGPRGGEAVHRPRRRRRHAVPALLARRRPRVDVEVRADGRRPRGPRLRQHRRRRPVRAGPRRRACSPGCDGRAAARAVAPAGRGP
jgi:class 3 adenylate cyclase